MFTAKASVVSCLLLRPCSRILQLIACNKVGTLSACDDQTTAHGRVARPPSSRRPRRTEHAMLSTVGAVAGMHGINVSTATPHTYRVHFASVSDESHESKGCGPIGHSRAGCDICPWPPQAGRAPVQRWHCAWRQCHRSARGSGCVPRSAGRGRKGARLEGNGRYGGG